ncbi:MAG: metallophosphoesterase [Lewinellaceae bacterium]|nr:metallophosphoesterase [Lewinellaceae bacterium]
MAKVPKGHLNWLLLMLYLFISKLNQLQFEEARKVYASITPYLDKTQPAVAENWRIAWAYYAFLAGDCFYLGDDYGKYDFIRRVADEFEAVYILPGNHEYYGGYDAATAMGVTFEAIRSNIFLVNNTSVELQGTRLIFSTMWSLIHENIPQILHGVTDFHRIKYQGGPLTVNHFNALHEAAFRFLEEETAKEGAKLVFTHHLPSNECNIEQFKGSALNPAFCVEKTWFVAASDVAAWVYGHSHRNIPEFEINGTRMLTNQLGYVGWGEHRTFERDKVVETGGESEG